ncbi:hypothetical protein BHE74_00002507, partial [Ensete ventricosum]
RGRVTASGINPSPPRRSLSDTGKGEKKGDEGLMGSTCLFVLCLFALCAAAVARLTPLIEELGRPRAVADIFDTSNYGKLQLDNGLARTPQMGSAYLVPSPSLLDPLFDGSVLRGF